MFENESRSHSCILITTSHITLVRSIILLPEMRGPPQDIPWPPQGGEHGYGSPVHLSRQPSRQHLQTHHSLVPPPHSPYYLNGLDSGIPEALMRSDQWSPYGQVTGGMTASRGPIFIPAAPPKHTSHAPHVDYGHTHHPSDRLNIRLSAPPQYLDPAFSASSTSLPASSKPTEKAESNTERLPDNKGNLERMRHERELIFKTAATELDQARRDVAPSVPSNKAWENAWEVMRQSMARM